MTSYFSDKFERIQVNDHRSCHLLTHYTMTPYSQQQRRQNDNRLHIDPHQVRYSRLLEEGDFRGRTANFVLMLMFGVASMTLVASYADVHFLGHAMTFMMLYVWGRRNEDVKMSIMGIFTFHAPYFPWVMLAFSVLLGNSVTTDLMGIVVGHTYYYLEYVYPVLSETRNWPLKRIMEPPALLHWLCGTYRNNEHPHQD